MSRHIVQGRIVAEARHFLERHDRAEKADEILAEVDGATLTAASLRVLLAEHDAYRDEARVLGEQAAASAVDPAELTVMQLRAGTKAAWLREREDPYRRDFAGYLGVAYDQMERACKAAGIAPMGAEQ